MRAFWAISMIGLHLFVLGQIGITGPVGFMALAGPLTFIKVDLPKLSPIDKLFGGEQ